MSIEQHDPVVIEGEVMAVDLLAEVMPRPLQHPPALRELCPCGKRAGDDYAHGAIGDREPFTCGEVLAIRRRVEAGAQHPHRAVRRLFRRLAGGAR